MWDDLVAMALVGTQRQKGEISPDSFSDSLNTLLSQLTTPDQQLNLLNAITLLSLYNRAGKVPSKYTGSLAEPCELDDQEVCSPAINKMFIAMTKGTYKVLLPELLESIA